ncbi:helix-turn-helix domain-containing GNAT family N-acetyltransferase [Myxococcus sp. CA040A]|uniref:bifunctional helix-turn-helix transcriptional regulator/GNAT family N-acetyltransferase n=1 Tax=Myxococcus sp. CA040A TaxID=2741738 RepID=UPI00157AB045|nr:helix-turn-helix domain-containing GNAT family N-acetyltransferase [Myxococcus sp. CA040A]NTX09006.1 MarR family transcriptional regulator [Myxococcus sp. CA040A]
MAQTRRDQGVAAVRHFNRFYTQKIGVLDEGLLNSEFSLTEARVIYELFHRETPTAAELSRELALDPGYLSRLLRNFGTQGLIEKVTSATDGRQHLVRLTAKGEQTYERLNSRSHDSIRALISPLKTDARQRLLEAMQTIQELLGEKPPASSADVVLRPHRPGDIGWVIHRHGVLYSQEYGWDERFEALVASVAAKFILEQEPARERCWIAEVNGRSVGSVFLVRDTKTVAKLRLLLVEPSARGLGIGTRLVDACVTFAREAGYRKVRLWTDSQLHAARRVYEGAGFVRVSTEPHQEFGEGLIGETWELKL